MRVDFWGDYVSPFCHLAEIVLGESGAAAAAVVRRPYELWPADEPDAPHVDADAWAIAAAIARRLGAPLRLPPLLPRTLKAHEAAAFAAARGRFAEMQRALYHALWVEGRDIGRVDVLAGLGEQVGLDALELRIALDLDHHADEVRAETERARAAGIDSVPVFVRGAQVLAGLQPARVLRAFLNGDPIPMEGAGAS